MAELESIAKRTLALKIAALLPGDREEALSVLGLVADVVDWAYPGKREPEDEERGSAES